MSTIKDTARQFFDACETGKGWDVCRTYCHQEASFSAQAGTLANVSTLQAYTDWMKGLFSLCPDARYEIRSFAVDDERNNVAAYGIFRGTHTGEVDRCRRPESGSRRTMCTSWSSTRAASAT